MTSHVVYDGVQRHSDGTDLENTMFAGQKLWFAHNVPLRKYLMENARNNGAIIVDFDKDADVRLVDHAKKNNAPGTHSFKYVELSIREGRREDLADHAVGVASRVSRPVGSTTTAPKQGRTPFTNEDDQQLWDWVKPYEESGGAWKGNEIYKQLEAVNPRHTYQSWRDRWIKFVRYQKRTTTPQTPEEEEEEERDEIHSPPGSPEVQPSRPAQQRKRRRSDVDQAGRQETQVHASTRPSTIRDRQSVRGSDRNPSDSPSHHQPTRFKTKTITTIESPKPPVGKKPRAETTEIEQNEDPEITTEERLDSHSDVLHIRQPLSTEKRDELYELVPTLSDMTAELFQEAWADLVSLQGWGELSPKQWQTYFEKIIVPEYCRRNNLSAAQIAPYLSQQQALPESTNPQKQAGSNARIDDDKLNARKIACGFCLEATSSTWHVHNRYDLVCTQCAVFLRIEGVPGPSIAPPEDLGDSESRIHSRVLTDSRTPQSSARPLPTLTSSSKRRHSVDRPESLSLTRNPEPNEARKRSSAKGSQSQSTSQDTQPAAWEVPPMLDQTADFLEEQTIPISAPLTSNVDPEEPLSDPQSSLESISHVLASKGQDRGSRPDEDKFHTAPETLDDFESAPEELPLDPGTRSAKEKGRRLSTQALYNNLNDPLDESYLDLDLPEPAGGWEQALGYEPDEANDHGLDLPDIEDEAGSRKKDKGKAQIHENPRHDPISIDPPSASQSKKSTLKQVPTTTSSTGGPVTSNWLASQTAIHTNIHPTTLRPILFKVLATSSFDIDVAGKLLDIVIDQIPSKYKQGKIHKSHPEIIIPNDMPGVWTSEDDKLLQSGHSADVKAVRQKHGEVLSDNRLRCLHVLLDT